MKQYLDLLQRIKTEGVRKDDRTGTGTRRREERRPYGNGYNQRVRTSDAFQP